MVEQHRGREQNQNYLTLAQEEIKTLTENILGLRQRLVTDEKTLRQLVDDYQEERYRRQEEIWQDRGLTKCTLCFDIPPGHIPNNYDQRIPTRWGGWGLMPSDEARYISISGEHWHTNHESDSHHTHLYFHRLCNHCYLEKLRDQATGKGGFRDLNPDQVEAINSILEKHGNTYQGDQELRRIYGHRDEIKIYWHQLSIPEGAYEIGTVIKI